MPLANTDRGPLIRHALLGITCFALNLALMWTLVAVIGIHVLAATSICFIVLNTVGHHYSRKLVFEHNGQRYGKSLIRFTLVMIISFVLNIAAMAISTQWLEIPFLVASAMIAGLFFLGNFIAHRDWTFR